MADPTEITDDELNELSKTAPNGHWVGCAWDRDDVDYVKRRPCICGQRVVLLIAALRAARERLATAEAVCEASRKCLAVYGVIPTSSRPRSWADWRDAMLAFDALAHPTTEEPTE